jgi:beta-galactosidase
VTVSLLDASGHTLQTVRNQTHHDSEGFGSEARATLNLDRSHLWNAEDPSRYTLVLSTGLPGEGEMIVDSVGVRAVDIDAGVLRVNHRPVKLHGCTASTDMILNPIRASR